MLFRALSFLFLVVYILNFFVKIPYFYVVYLLFIIVLVFLHFKEVNGFKQAIEHHSFDFYIRANEPNSVLDYILTFFVLFVISNLFYSIPIAIRDFTALDFLFLFLTFILLTFLTRERDCYTYYYFGEEFIKKPGLPLSKIYWHEVKDVYEHEKDELIIVELHNGSSIKIGTEPYYSFWKNKNELLTYIQHKINSPTQPCNGNGCSTPTES